jgi:flagellar biosynthetic protein FliR
VNIYQFQEGQLLAFVLVLLRNIAFVVTSPILGSAAVPSPVKVLFSLLLSIMMFPVVHIQNPETLAMGEQIIFLSLRELMVGLFLGSLARMFFQAVSVSGEIIAISMGTSAAQLFNPVMGSQSNVVGQFQFMVVTVVFLAIQGHHLFISAMAESFRLVPIGVIVAFVTSFQDVFILGIKIAAPIIVAVFTANIAMGVINRAVPQIDVMVTSLPITLLLGLAILILTLPMMVGEMDILMQSISDQLMQAMKVI